MEERELAALFSSLRPRDEEVPDLSEARRLTEERLARSGTKQGMGWRILSGSALQKGWSEMWRPANWSLPRLAAAVCLLLVVLACTVPVDYGREEGMSLRLKVTGDAQPVLELLRHGPWGLVAFNVEENGSQSIIEARLRDARTEDLEALRALAVVEELDSEPWDEERRGTLFSMMLDNVFHVRLDISGMSDEQINTALAEQLRAQGFSGQVSVTHQDGMPEVSVQVAGDSTMSGRPVMIELSRQAGGLVTEGAFVTEGGGLNLDLGGLDGLSEEQIRERVLAQLREQGVNQDSVEVIIQQSSEEHDGMNQVQRRIEVQRRE